MKQLHGMLFRRLLLTKRLFVFVVLVTALGGYALSVTQTGSAFSVWYYTIFHANVMTYLIIALFLWTNEWIADMFDRHQVLLRYTHVQTWWREKIIGMGMSALFFTFFMNGVLLVTLLVSGQLDGVSVRYILLGILMQVAGFLLFGALYHLLTLLFSRTFFGFVLVMVMVLLLQAGKFVFKTNYLTVEEYMILMHKHLLGHYSLMATDMIPFLWLIVLFSMIYMVGSAVAKDTDFYWSE